MESLVALSYETIIYTISLLVLTATSATNRFSSLLKSIISRWTSAYYSYFYFGPISLCSRCTTAL